MSVLILFFPYSLNCFIKILFYLLTNKIAIPLKIYSNNRQLIASNNQHTVRTQQAAVQHIFPELPITQCIIHYSLFIHSSWKIIYYTF